MRKFILSGNFLKRKLPVFFSMVVACSYAQTGKQTEAIRSKTNVKQLKNLEKKVNASKISTTELQKIAKNKNLVFSGESNGSFFQLKGFNQKTKLPIYYTTYNAGAASGTETNRLNSTGGILNLDGQGMTLYEWDGGGVKASHREFGGRVTQKDNAQGSNFHSTHVAGTMVASGVDKKAKGMAPLANLNAYDWNDDNLEMIAAAANAALVSNHSYGALGGFAFGEWSGYSAWHWFGSDEDIEFSGFGKYSESDSLWDLIIRNAPYYLPVKSAGNSRGAGPAPGQVYFRYDEKDNVWKISDKVRPLNGGASGYDCINFGSVAKNTLVVAAANKLKNAYKSSNDVNISSFSSFGPTDDGRIKPDISGIGVDVYSSASSGDDSYGTLSGTSMSAPNVTGSLGLLQQHYRDLHNGDFMKATTLKALVIATAKEAGNPGPDYIYGWGLLDAFKAASAITTNNTYTYIQERTLNNGSEEFIDLVASGTEPLVATIVWNDPAPIVTADNTPINDRTKMLVNDLDARITAGTDTFNPWVLDPANPSFNATKGDNIIDNVEQVYIANPVAGTTYRLRISHKGTLKTNEIVNDKVTLKDTGNQDYSLVVTGVKNSVQTDMELRSLTIDVPASAYNNNTPITAKYRNNGSSAVSMAKLQYTFTNKDTDAVVSTGTLDLPEIQPGAEANISFNVDLSTSFVNYDIDAKIILENDAFPINNKQTVSAFGNIVDLTAPESTHFFGFEEDFDKYGWTAEDVNKNGVSWFRYIDSGYSHSGSSFAINFPNLSKGTDDWLYSNPLKMKANGKYRIIFYVNKVRSSVEEKLDIAIGTAAKSSAMTTNITKESIIVDAKYDKHIYYFSPTEDNTYYIGFHNKTAPEVESYAVLVDDVTIEQSEKPFADFDASKTAFNSYETIKFTSNVHSSENNPITSYQWSFVPNTVTYQSGTNATSPNPEVIFNNEGTYSVSLTIKNSTYETTATKQAYVTAKNTPTVAYFNSDRTTIYKGESISLKDFSIGDPFPTSWKWEITPTEGVTFINGTTDTSRNPSVKFDNIGSYTVKLTSTSLNNSDDEIKTDFVTVKKANPVRNLTGKFDTDKNVALKWSRPILEPFYREGFEGNTTKISNMYDENDDGVKWIISTALLDAATGNRSVLSYSFNIYHNMNDWMVTNLIPKGAEELSFWVRHGYGSEAYDVYLVKKENVAGEYPTLDEIKTGTQIYDYSGYRFGYSNIKVDVSTYKNSEFYLAFHHKTGFTWAYHYLNIDDIEVGYNNTATARMANRISSNKIESPVIEDGKHIVPDKTINAALTENLVTNSTAEDVPLPKLSGYTIYRDNSKIADISDFNTLTFSETVTDNKPYVYDVYAIYDGNPSDKMSVTVDLTALATDENTANKDLKVFPNPSSGLFKIEAGNNVSKLNAQVFDLSGKLILTKKSDSSNLDLDLTKEGKGVYILVTVDNNGKKHSVKLIVQ